MNTKTTLTLAFAAAIGAATGIASTAQAAGNPFAMQSLKSGYMVASADEPAMAGKAKDGKCSTGKCGANKAKAKKAAKAKDGKCGANKAMDTAKDSAKPMDGKCGANKSMQAGEAGK